ncbi:hypothetical protein FB192DRAFT_1402011 [Mucor lusitanicus]|uniref:C2H2-type domain-containing protein n=1 Tax=Mucor circinelloides f. lusitanicus TaxID=29924 RepID=A0A8H4B8F3_MUCCL|nr:hypothetical protein FB192DRAFT_1402011 [Mucor lusitanicus]
MAGYSQMSFSHLPSEMPPHYCYDCNKQYKSSGSYRSHLFAYHTLEADLTLKNGKLVHISRVLGNSFICVCGSLYGTRDSLRRHCSKNCKLVKSVKFYYYLTRPRQGLEQNSPYQESTWKQAPEQNQASKQDRTLALNQSSNLDQTLKLKQIVYIKRMMEIIMLVFIALLVSVWVLLWRIIHS